MWHSPAWFSQFTVRFVYLYSPWYLLTHLAVQLFPNVSTKKCEILFPMFVCKYFHRSRIGWHYLLVSFRVFGIPEIRHKRCAHLRYYFMHLIHPPLIVPFKVILALRTWAVCGGNRLIGIGLTVLAIIDAAVRFPFINKFVKSVECAYYILSV
jgi:hypothetical protein